MAAFSYVALDATGKKVRGLIEGDSERQVRSQLKHKNLRPIEVSTARKKTESGLSWLTLSRSWKASELALVTRQLATLVQSNLPLAEAIEAVAQQASKPSIKAVLMAVRSRVNEGHSLAKAMAEHPAVFNELYLGMVRAGEHAGFLGVVLERLADYTEKAHHAARQIRTASIYPVVLLLVSLLVIVLLMVFVVPDLVRIFDNTEGDLPWLTRALIATSDAIAEYGLWMLLATAAVFFLFRLWLRAPVNRRRWHRFLLHVPVLSGFINTLDTTRFSSTLGTLLQSGVPLLEALAIAQSVLVNLHYRERADVVIEAVREGKSLRYALDSCGFFPPILVHMVASGERSGELAGMLVRAAESQEREIEAGLAALMGILGPMLVLFCGGFVAAIVLAILLPIFGMNQLF